MKPTPPPPPPPPPPYDARIEYLESNGTQYIDTEYYVNEATIFRMKYSGFTDKYFACGSREAFGKPGLIFSNGGSSYSFYDKFFLYYGVRFNASKNCSNDDLIHEVEMTNIVKVDGITINTFEHDRFNGSMTMSLFCLSESRARRYGTMRIYSCSFIEDRNIIRDFIPVRVGQIGYMYDRVSGQLFGNAGTGEFILGPDIFQDQH